MTLSALIELANTNVDYNNPEVKARFEEMRKRHREFDEVIERQARLKEPSNELLNRSCSI